MSVASSMEMDTGQFSWLLIVLLTSNFFLASGFHMTGKLALPQPLPPCHLQMSSDLS